MNFFKIGVETNYSNILKSILQIQGKPIVSYSSNAIVIQFLDEKCHNQLCQMLFEDRQIKVTKIPPAK